MIDFRLKAKSYYDAEEMASAYLEAYFDGKTINYPISPFKMLSDANVQLIRTGLPPIYIRVEEKKEYIKALEKADSMGCYDDLYEIIFKALIRTHVELSVE